MIFSEKPGITKEAYKHAGGSVEHVELSFSECCSLLPFGNTHINTFKKMVDTLNAEKFTIEQLAIKFRA